MATIKARRQANGSIRYTAIVRKRVGKSIVQREARTVTHRSAALSWAKHREVELEKPDTCRQKQLSAVTLAELARSTGSQSAKRSTTRSAHPVDLSRTTLNFGNSCEGCWDY